MKTTKSMLLNVNDYGKRKNGSYSKTKEVEASQYESIHYKLSRNIYVVQLQTSLNNQQKLKQSDYEIFKHFSYRIVVLTNSSFPFAKSKLFERNDYGRRKNGSCAINYSKRSLTKEEEAL